MRGDTDNAMAFQQWLADEVVSTIRKTGKLDAEQLRKGSSFSVLVQQRNYRHCRMACGRRSSSFDTRAGVADFDA